MITKLRLAAAIKIQNNFRLVRFLKLGPKIRRGKRNAAATIVQKYMRGYLQKKQIEKEVLDTKLMNCHNFFKKVKNDY